MKFYILTYQRGGNEGAVLQAYSLYSYLLNYGECQVIDYCSYPLCNADNPWRYAKFLNNKIFLLNNKIFLLKRIYFSMKRRIKFDKFRNNYMNLTSKIKQDTNTKLYCDFCFVGSDQLLNPLLNFFDINYFNPSFIIGKKIFYGGSTVTRSFINNEHYKIIYDSIPNYKAISAREESTEFLLKKFTKNVKLVCDPVFLNDKAFWLSLADKTKRKFDKNFIFIYYPNQKLLEKAIEYSKKYCLTLYCIPVWRKIEPSPMVKIICDDGPLDFLYLLYHSQFNFLGSFHAVCLSLILNKKFVAKFSTISSEDRINTVFKKLSLPDCRSFENYDSFPINNWNEINENIKKYAQDSKEWIKKVISSNENSK